ncbi:AI-2E family transporter [Enterococcus sp. MJM12]|uniref:AI-2E family transporter n=1 Tax=Candidatus Enterococcus myersii TaxID=2815322 RepID=A0ABS3HAP3_9ENTE|nr:MULTISPECIES: AI-2E family transporter [Enterococcus]MBO0450535.1 AI-2E family transporter [Enterococcus sp. MJM12]MCD1023453.1 AI-2E family transporter [Enterococcus sp. SMC-9]MDT2738659.1 AI-2E family transporter [Enterococcus canintestini]
MKLYHNFVANLKLRRYVVLLSIIFLLYFARSLMTPILLTFIFTYLAIHFVQLVQRLIKIKPIFIVVALYGGTLLLLYIALTNYIPILFHQTWHMVDTVIDFYDNQPTNSNQVLDWILQYVQRSEFLDQLKGGASFIIGYLHDFGKLAVSLALSFLLSFFFTVELKKVKDFSKLFFTSDFGWFFQDIFYFAQKFINTFGVVLEAQFFIAIVNTVITVIGLAIMGFHQLPSLGLMVFLFSLIPVAGAIISSIPLSFIAYSQGGMWDLIFILFMILGIHILEAYVLNPKFMSSRTELPIFYTFVILLVAERLFGIWGLIVGIPIFTFFLDVMKVKKIPHSET